MSNQQAYTTHKDAYRWTINHIIDTTLFSMREWFSDELAAAMSLYEVVYGRKLSEAMTARSEFKAAMTADSRFTIESLPRDAAPCSQQ